MVLGLLGHHLLGLVLEHLDFLLWHVVDYLLDLLLLLDGHVGWELERHGLPGDRLDELLLLSGNLLLRY